MQQASSHILLTRNDYDIINRLVREGTANKTFNRQDAEELHKELKKAKLVDSSDFPPHVVRLNSTVTIQDQKDGKMMELTLVTPEKTDIRQKKISIMSPIGTALIGFSKGQQVSWKVPAGKRTFVILDVVTTVREKELAAESEA